MRVTRRAMIKSGLTASALAVTGGGVHAAPAPEIVLFDSRDPQSRAFAARWRNSAILMIDVADQEARRWSTLRRTLPAVPVRGLTRWSELVVARGWFEEKGKRLTRETRSGMLFEWEMA